MLRSLELPGDRVNRRRDRATRAGGIGCGYVRDQPGAMCERRRHLICLTHDDPDRSPQRGRRGLLPQRSALRQLDLADSRDARRPRPRQRAARAAAAGHRCGFGDLAADGGRGDRAARHDRGHPARRGRLCCRDRPAVTRHRGGHRLVRGDRAVPLRRRHRRLGRLDERRGRSGRAADRTHDHAPLPRGVQPRHGGGVRARRVGGRDRRTHAGAPAAPRGHLARRCSWSARATSSPTSGRRSTPSRSPRPGRPGASRGPC